MKDSTTGRMDKSTETPEPAPRANSRGGRSGGGSGSNGAVFFLGFWGWLFTIAFLHLTFWQGVLAIVIWPLYLGWHFSPFHGGG